MATSTPECAICFAAPDAHLSCARCHAVYCAPCLTRWYEAQPHCPACRLETSLSAYVHDAALQLQLDATETPCDYCMQPVATAVRRQHAAVCRSEEIACPYAGCGHRAPRAEMEIHTVVCRLSDQYSADAILDAVCRRNVRDTHAAVLRNRTMVDGLLTPPEEDANSGTLVHHVALHDTLAGIAIKYNTSKHEIMRLNRMTHESQMFGRSTLIVPRPPGWSAKQEPDVPVDVLVALKKRRLARDLMRQTGVSEEEAVAYLHLAGFYVESALKLVQEDKAWAERQKKSKQPASFKQFLVRLANEPRCYGCTQPLSEKRSHCTCCGKFFCSTCQYRMGHCQQVVPKRLLGATSPEACNSLVQVCVPCFNNLHGIPPEGVKTA